MIDKQQLQAMGEHQSEQHMCMAKQIEDLQARLQECAKGAAKMQEQRDALAKQVLDLTASIANSLTARLDLNGIDTALAGKLPDHVAGVVDVVPDGWQLVRIEHANDVAETVIEDHVVTEWDHRWQEISGYRCGYCSLSGNTCDDVINGEHDHDCVITKARSMLAAAPKQEPTK